MTWPENGHDEPDGRLSWRRFDSLLRRLPKSAYWSGVCKDVGKYVLLGAAVAPFFGLESKVTSFSLSVFGLLIAALLLYLGYRLDPDEP